MHILLAHNRYQQTGGEESAYAAELALLLQHGHTVTEFLEDNRRIPAMNRLALAAQTVWSRPAFRTLSGIIKRDRPDVAYFFNTFPLFSPSVYFACRENSVPVVQGLHNYRLLCPSAEFFRSGRVCQECLGKTPPWPGVVYKCYRGSRAQTAVTACMIAVHRWLRTWRNKVDGYIAPTEFLRNKYIEGGFSPEKIFVKPHFIMTDPGRRENPGDYAVYAGRLSQEKGIRTLLKSWQMMESRPLKILGGGPLESEIRTAITERRLSNTEFLEQVPRERVAAILKSARFLVFPSECFESFGLSIIEAFACGVPVIASRLGAMAELVSDHRTGLLFFPGDHADLRDKIEWAWNHPQEIAGMGDEARREFEEKYPPGKNYQQLMKIFADAIRQNPARRNI